MKTKNAHLNSRKQYIPYMKEIETEIINMYNTYPNWKEKVYVKKFSFVVISLSDKYTTLAFLQKVCYYFIK